MQTLKNKVVLITGASKGIGAKIALSVASEGAKVIVNYNHDQAGADKVVSQIKESVGEAVAIQANVSSRENVENLFAKSKEVFGNITTLVNNAGVYKFEPIETVTEDEFHLQFNTNVLGTFLTTQQAIPHFENNGEGSIINIGSVASVKPTPMTSLYSATKGATDAFTSTLAQELGSKKIRVNSILPGPTVTDGNPMNDEVKSFVQSQTPMGAIGKTDDIAQLAVFLTSDNAFWVTGQKIEVSGGF
ncbi:SDR family NAD(P)-dependent oxidoreductase [Reichenbachiella versicolor]|uniref:SDR family NAD(P)-dependent oxidoreductase n=1 Tax=Reichenbachiella versicolor TaxID=1821036 RepID=UPI000D6E0CEB|nr:glucose 1-dehydrogenase [Reichenbachiella versicolor]